MPVEAPVDGEAGFDRALTYAEKLQEAYDAARLQLIIAEGAAAIFVFLVWVCISTLRKQLDQLGVAEQLAILCGILVAGFAIGLTCWQLYVRVRRDRATLSEIARMLHELESLYSRSSSPVEKALFKMRLARLEIRADR